MEKGSGRQINLELRTFGKDSKRNYEKEKGKKRGQIKESNGSCRIGLVLKRERRWKG